MIPTLILAGVIAVVAAYRRPVVLLMVGVLVAAMWGVGVSDGDIGVLAGGSALALANYLVGAAVAVGIRALFSAARTKAQPRPDS